MFKITQRFLVRERRAWTRLAPTLRSVWNSQFMDAQAASEIGKEIRMVELEKTLVKTHPDLKKLSIEEDTKKLEDLHEKYKRLTGEAFDAQDEDEGALSELEEIEVELRLLSNQILKLQSKSSSGDHNIQKQISHMKATVAALQEEYETMVHRTKVDVD